VLADFSRHKTLPILLISGNPVEDDPPSGNETTKQGIYVLLREPLVPTGAALPVVAEIDTEVAAEIRTGW
jgi:hypothetical protein